MISYINGNIFLTGITDLYNAVTFPDKEYIKNKYHLVKKDGKILPRLELQKINTKAKEIYESNLILVEELRCKTPTFDDMFNFGTFLRSIDKFFFYKNNSRSVKVSCTQSLEVNDEREIIFVTDGSVTIKVYLKRLEDNGIDITIQTIEVYRYYGKKTISKFIIKDRDTVINTTDDIMLLNMINYTIQNIMADYFKLYLDAIYNNKLFDFSTYKYFEPNKQKEV